MTIRVQHQVTLNLDITPSSSPTYSELEGFDNFAEALNEIVQQYNFLDKDGYGESEITGMQPVITLTGIRNTSNEAQNYIFSKKYELLEERKTNLQVVYTDPVTSVTTTIEVDVTLANMVEFSGASTDGGAISVEMHFNSKPTVTNGNILELLTVVSVAGSTSGDTAIYVNPALTSGNSYRYQVAASVTLPVLNSDQSSLTAWNGTDDITATTGQEILIVEVDGSNLAVKAGKATVTSA